MKSPHKLQLTTPSGREIVLTRVFDGPRHLVFDAWTRPELLKRWFGPPGWSLPVCEVDLRVGGTYRFGMRHTAGRTMQMGGTYREIQRPERLVTTETFDEPWYPGEALNTMVLVEQGGKTTMSITTLYDTREIRDAVLKTPMERGFGECCDRLDEVLAAALAKAG